MTDTTTETALAAIATQLTASGGLGGGTTTVVDALALIGRSIAHDDMLSPTLTDALLEVASALTRIATALEDRS
jgi:hypothetical protein